MKNKIKGIALVALSLLVVSSCSTLPGDSSTTDPTNSDSTSDTSSTDIDSNTNSDVSSTDTSSNTDSSSIDETVASIKIVKDSIKTSVALNSTIDYTGLKIDLFNASNYKLDTLLVSDHKDDITYNTIDTTTAGEKTLTVTYKTTFTDSLVISVTTKSYTISSVTANKNYSYTVGITPNNKLSTSEDNVETGFMESISYHIGNLNSVDLMPSIVGIDEDNPLDSKNLDVIPTGSEVTLKDSSNKELSLGEYFDDVNAVKYYGQIKFKSSVTSGTYSLNYKIDSYDVTYNMTVVDNAWNVTKAIDLFALHNAKSNGLNNADNNNIKKLKEDNNLPYATSLIFQNDVTVTKNDVPEFYFWKAEENCDSTVVGSFKDWRGFITYSFGSEDKNGGIYGNGHRLVLKNEGSDDDFPKAITDEQSGAKQSDKQPVTSHSSFFHIDIDDGYANAQDKKFNVYDLEYSGNAPVSKDSEIKDAGEMFLKTRVSGEVKNSLITSAYIGIDLNAWMCTGRVLDVTNTRINDSFHTALYIYNNGTLNLNHCDIKQSGGPLMFTNPVCEDLASTSSSNYDISNFQKSVIHMNDSFLSNYTEGKGGWFQAYSGAEGLSSQIKALDGIFQAQLSMAFTKTDTSTGNNVQKFNLLYLNLPIHNSNSTQSGESLGLPSNGYGTNVEIYKDNELVYSTLQGLSTLVNAYANYSSSQSQENTMALLNALSNTDVGNNLFANTAFKSANQNIMTFRKYDTNATPHFALVGAGSYNGFQLYNTQYQIAQSVGQITDPTTYGIQSSPNDVFKTEGLLAANIQVQGFDGGVDKFSEYHGVCNYGVIFGDYHSLSN